MASAVDAARAAALSAFLTQVTPREADLAAAEATAPEHLRGVLSDAEISEVLRLADGCRRTRS